jgi:glycosyltransferase involved in cell wall biosynthesis
MDPENALMRIVHLLPEMDEGGVERHVLWLATAQAAAGCDVLVVSAGGRLAESLAGREGGPKHLTLPVHQKNPFVAARCAFRLASLVRREGWDMIHAHSRVPACIAWWTALLARVPWVVTCHALYSRNFGLFPYRKADGAICVSETVREWMRPFLPPNAAVIPNGLPAPRARWTPHAADGRPLRFCFIGRLTRIKGIADIVDAFCGLDAPGWSLDVVGDGPLLPELEERVERAGLKDRIRFHGYREDTETFLLSCDCFLFPSRSEGAGLTLMTALAMGVPVLASDIPAVREMITGGTLLVRPGDVEGWKKVLSGVVSRRHLSEVSPPARIWPTPEESAGRILDFCERVVRSARKR